MSIFQVSSLFSEEQTLTALLSSRNPYCFVPKMPWKYSHILLSYHLQLEGLCFPQHIMKLALSSSSVHLEWVVLSQIFNEEWATWVSVGIQFNWPMGSSAEEKEAHIRYGWRRTSHGIVPGLMLVVTKMQLDELQLVRKIQILRGS